MELKILCSEAKRMMILVNVEALKMNQFHLIEIRHYRSVSLDSEESISLLCASKNYEKAVQLNWNSPQELSAIVPAREKQNIVRTAISKFHAAIQLQLDFHRSIYNLGTVLYGLAEDVSRSGVSINAKNVDPNELYSQSAIYIAAAHALKPNFSVYNSALKLVRSM